MKKIIILFSLILFCSLTYGQKTFFAYMFPIYSNNVLSSEHQDVVALYNHIEEPIKALGYGLGFEYQRNNVFFHTIFDLNTYGHQVPKKELIFTGTGIEYTHYSTKTAITNLEGTHNIGYYFLNKKKYQLGSSLGLGIAYGYKIERELNFYYNNEILIEDISNNFPDTGRRINIVATLNLPLNIYLKEDFGLQIIPQSKILLLESMTEYSMKRNYFLSGCKFGVFKTFQ